MNEFEPLPGRVRTRNQMRSDEKKRIWTRSQTRLDKKKNACGWEAKRVRTRSQTRLEREAKCIQLRRQLRLKKIQTRSNKKPTAFNDKENALGRENERICSASTCIREKRVNECNAFKRESSRVKLEPTRVWTTTLTHSNGNQNTFEWGPTRIWTRIYTRLTVNWTYLFHMWNTFALHLVSDGYCMIRIFI